jgi:acetyl-CoA decarbonylase/synthase complex subunit gamma
MLDFGPGMMLNILLAYISGIVLTPMMLPWIPGRPFALKGFIAGFAVSLLLLAFHRMGSNSYEIVSWFMVITGLSSFLAMNFTGSSTYTSLSGVKKEMKVAVPLQIALAATGLVLMTIGRIKV